jgi:hypothetical protein
MYKLIDQMTKWRSRTQKMNDHFCGRGGQHDTLTSIHVIVELFTKNLGWRTPKHWSWQMKLKTRVLNPPWVRLFANNINLHVFLLSEAQS